MMLIRPRFLSPSPSQPSSRREPLLPALSAPPGPSRAFSSSYSSSARPPRPSPSKRPPPHHPPHTPPNVDLTRRRQLAQIIAEVEASKRLARSGRGGGINIIVMNAVLEACVSCGDVDLAVQLFEEMRGPMGCGVDDVSYGVLLKGLGIARRIDEAFEILESVEKDTSVGSPRLSAHLICGFLNALIEAGDMRRANALVARFRQVLYEGHSVLLYNLLMKGYIKSNFPLGALTVKDEILRQGLKPDRLTYNTIIFACVKSAEIEKAFQFLKDMKDEAKKDDNPELLPDAVTYTTLLKGLGNSQDLYSVLKIVVEMKSSLLYIDRTAYTAMADAFLACGSIDGALCIFGEIIKQAGNNKDLRPKPHLYLSVMRAFATIGDYDMVKRLRKHMWRDSVGSISRSAKQEANELLMEAAINNNQIDVARGLLRRIVNGKEHFSWTSRVGLLHVVDLSELVKLVKKIEDGGLGARVALKVETLSGFTNSPLRPHVFPQIFLSDPVEKYMIPFRESRPLCADLILENVAMRFLKDSVVPLVNDWGTCTGIVHSSDCTKMDAPLLSMARPPLCVPTSTSLEHVIDLILREKVEMVIVVKSGNMYEGSYTSSSRPLGVFSLAILSKLTANTSSTQSQTLVSPG